VPEEEKQARWRAVQSLMEETTARKNKLFEGKTVSVLVESVDGGWANGHSSEMKLVRFPCHNSAMVGQIMAVEVQKAGTWLLEGKCLTASQEIG